MMKWLRRNGSEDTLTVEDDALPTPTTHWMVGTWWHWDGATYSGAIDMAGVSGVSHETDTPYARYTGDGVHLFDQGQERWLPCADLGMVRFVLDGIHECGW